MLNYIWAVMMILGIVTGVFTGRMQELSQALVESAKEAVTLVIGLSGVVAMWSGMMKIAEDGGLVAKLTKALGPVLGFMFPNLPKESPAGAYIAMNIAANMAGLGWAATPAGLTAMEELEKLERERRKTPTVGHIVDWSNQGAQKKGTASDEMCTFLILNISSLQLIPVNIIAYRSQYGSVNPTGIVGPAIVATAVSTLVAVVFCKIISRKKGQYMTLKG